MIYLTHTNMISASKWNLWTVALYTFIIDIASLDEAIEMHERIACYHDITNE